MKPISCRKKKPQIAEKFRQDNHLNKDTGLFHMLPPSNFILMILLHPNWELLNETMFAENYRSLLIRFKVSGVKLSHKAHLAAIMDFSHLLMGY